MMPSPSEKTEAGKHGNDDKKLVRRDTGRELKLRDGKKKLPFSKEDRSNSSKTVTVNENRAIDEEEEYLNDVNDRFENDDTQDDKIQPDKVDDADRDMDEYERKMNETANKDDVNYDKTNKASEENEFRRDSMKTQNSRRQDDKRQSISHYQSGGGGETKQITRNDSKRNVTAPKKYPFNRYNSYKDARSRIDTGRDRNVRKSVDTGRNMVVDRRQSHAIVEEDQEQVETDRFGRLRGYRFNEESESFDLIDYRDEWEESPENDVSVGLNTVLFEFSLFQLYSIISIFVFRNDCKQLLLYTNALHAHESCIFDVFATSRK